MNRESIMVPISRRQALRTFANGFGMIGLAGLLAAESGPARAADADNPLAVKPPMFEPRAKRVIFLFMSGGPSHVDLFDPKPRLDQDNGKPLPFEQPKLVRTRTTNLLKSPFKFSKRGQSGIEISELFPKVGGCIDDICLIRSMVADNINHNGACLQMNTGEQAFSRPSLGSWLLYGLGSVNQSLPGFIVVSPSQPAQGAPLWSSSFLPAAYQGTLVADLDAALAALAEFERRFETIGGFGANELGLLERQRFAVVGGEDRLGVEEIDVRRAAGHEQEDDALGLRLEHGRLDGERVVGVGGAGAAVVGGEEAGEADQAEAVGEGAQRLTAVDREVGKQWVHRVLSSPSVPRPKGAARTDSAIQSPENALIRAGRRPATFRPAISRPVPDPSPARQKPPPGFPRPCRPFLRSVRRRPP